MEQTKVSVVNNEAISMAKALQDDIGSDMLQGFLAPLLPKLPLILKPAFEKMKNYLGNDERRISITSINGNIMVIIYNPNLPFEISSKTGEDGKIEKKFKISKEAVLEQYPVEKFIEGLLSGNLF
jgi:hypothetical protein